MVKWSKFILRYMKLSVLQASLGRTYRRLCGDFGQRLEDSAGVMKNVQRLFRKEVGVQAYGTSKQYLSHVDSEIVRHP